MILKKKYFLGISRLLIMIRGFGWIDQSVWSIHPKPLKKSTFKNSRDGDRSDIQWRFGQVRSKWFPSLKGQEFFTLILTGEIFNKKSKALTDPGSVIYFCKPVSIPLEKWNGVRNVKKSGLCQKCQSRLYNRIEKRKGLKTFEILYILQNFIFFYSFTIILQFCIE